MPASEARIQANRANAARSTGPKTAEGKARSRANALKHGMAGSGVVLPEEDRARWEERADSWAEELGAVDKLGRFLAGRAALASVRLDRCVRAETAVLEERRRIALDRWGVERERRAQITHHAARWAHEPAETVAGLEATARGCEWLLDFWEYLAGLLRADGFWDQRHTARIVNLVGVHAPEVATLLWKCSLALTADLNDPADLEWAHDVLKIDDAEADLAVRRASIAATLPGRAEARESITAICESERDRLQSRQQRLWDALDGPARDRALAMAAFDDGEGATLRRRYETASTSDLHRALNQIHKNHRERDREPVESEPTDLLRNEQSWPSEGPPYPMKVRACTLPPTRGLSEEPNGAAETETEVVIIATVAADPPGPVACPIVAEPASEPAAESPAPAASVADAVDSARNEANDEASEVSRTAETGATTGLLSPSTACSSHPDMLATT